MTPVSQIETPAGYTPQVALAFGDTAASPVTRDGGMPTAPRSQPAFHDRLLREGWQATATYVRGDNSAQSYTVGQALGGYSPPPGRALWISNITVSSTRDATFWIQRGDQSLLANGAIKSVQAVNVGPSYGGTVIIPVASFLAEGESVQFSVRTEIAQNVSGDFSWMCGIDGRLITNDFWLEAARTMLVIGDSISCTTIPGGTAYGCDFYHSLIAQELRAAGKPIRRIVKGDGGWKTAHAVTAMKRGQLDVGPADLILLMLGTNEVSVADFSANLRVLLGWKMHCYPGAELIVLAPPPRADAAETETMVPMRVAAQSVVAEYDDPKISYVSLAGAFAATAANLPDNVHPTAAAHQAMAAQLAGAMKQLGVMDRI